MTSSDDKKVRFGFLFQWMYHMNVRDGHNGRELLWPRNRVLGCDDNYFFHRRRRCHRVGSYAIVVVIVVIIRNFGRSAANGTGSLRLILNGEERKRVVVVIVVDCG
jgi:hypothetical protein